MKNRTQTSVSPRNGLSSRDRRGSFVHAALIVLTISRVPVLHGQAFVDPGFESYGVSAGGFIQPASGPWLFGNDAGLVEPPAPNSSTGPLNTWSAIFSPVEGQQYASTYAGADTLRQMVTFSAPGD